MKGRDEDRKATSRCVHRYDLAMPEATAHETSSPDSSDGSPDVMPVAVVGVGRMGRHHARTYAAMSSADLRGVVDADLPRAQATAEEYGTQAYGSADALLEAHPDLAAVSVAVPTVYHRPAAEPLLTRGVACLVEKPLAASSTEARAIAALAEQGGAVLQVGHTERFNPAVRAVIGLGLRPRFLEVVRISPMTFRSLDVGVVMDLMIHDLDIVLTLAGAPIVEVHANGVCVFGESEDLANARLVFANGCVANLTASRLAMKTDRRLRLFSEDGYVSLDYQNRTGAVIRRSSETADTIRSLRERVAAGEDLSQLDYAQLINFENLSMVTPDGIDDPLTAELTAFCQAVRTKSRPPVSAEDGIAAVDAAERVLKAIEEHRYAGLDKPRMD